MAATLTSRPPSTSLLRLNPHAPPLMPSLSRISHLSIPAIRRSSDGRRLFSSLAAFAVRQDLTTWTQTPLVRIEPASADASLFHVSVDVSDSPDVAGNFTSPGQYVQLRIPSSAKPAFLAIASPPEVASSKGEFEFLIKKMAGSTAEALCELRRGDLVEIGGVMGKGFEMERVDGVETVLIFATGSGISYIPVDIYIGGAEHSVLHLLYARFWHKVLYDIGVVSTKEPFQCLINQGLILGEVEYTACKDKEGRLISADSISYHVECYQEKIPVEKVTKVGDFYVLKTDPSIRLIARAYKMSKSRGNVINPDDVVSEYGADSLRLYEMFMGPLRDSKTWSTGGIEGVHRFLGRTWRLIVGPPLPDGSYKDGSVAIDGEPTFEQLRALHQCIEKVSEEIQETRFNTGISAMMEFINAAYKWDRHPKSIMSEFVLLLSPYAPHMAEELWFRLGHSSSLAYESFPEAKDEYLKGSSIVLPVQINGKTRGTILVEETCSEDDAFRLASVNEKLSKYLIGKTIKKRIYVPGRILNVILEQQKVQS